MQTRNYKLVYKLNIYKLNEHSMTRRVPSASKSILATITSLFLTRTLKFAIQIIHSSTELAKLILSVLRSYQVLVTCKMQASPIVGRTQNLLSTDNHDL